MVLRGRRSLGALVLLAVLLVSGLAVLPSRVLGQGNEINGIISDCATTAILSGATVTLTEANGARPPSTVTTAGDGTYAFPAQPGHYTILVEKAGYFDGGNSTPFRFDGTATVEKDFCLDPTPVADSDLTLLVVTAASVLRTNELVRFPSTSTTNENTASTWNPAANTVQVSKRPLTSQGLSIRYERVDGTFSKNFVNNTDYVVQDYFTGIIEILNATAIADLDADVTRARVLVTYLSWTPSSRLQFFPVLEASYTAFKNGSSWLAEEGIDWTLDIDTGIVTILGNFINGTDTLRFTYRSVAALSGAIVDAYYAPMDQVVATGTTSASGFVSLALWMDSFELRTTASGYMPNITSVTISALETDMRIRMEGGVTLSGHARNAASQFVSEGLTGTLYNTNLAVTAAKFIRATVVGSMYTFHAPPGTYRMVIDANGYKAANVLVTLVSGSVVSNVVLAVSDEERYDTTVVYGAADWNNLTIYRNFTLNPDSTLTGLEPADLRDLRLQIDFTLGDGDGAVDGTEPGNFQAWVVANGPFYVTTQGFLTTNGKSYLSATSYSVSVQGLPTAGSKVWINTSTTYSAMAVPPYIATGAKNYFVNATLIPDTNITEYRNYTYLVALPRTYERVIPTTILPSGAPVTIEGFTRITLDPGVTSPAPQVRMTVERSLNGTARAKVIAPIGKFHVVNASFDNYTAFVAADTNITFSAADSTDPVGPIEEANFTWEFSPSPADVRYGIEPTFNFTTGGEYTVSLAVNETGGNVTTRDITIFVDDQLPIAQIRTNRTTGNANGTTLRVDEDILVRFDGGFSTDLAYLGSPDKAGVILATGYAWDFDGDGDTDATTKIVNHTFSTPGEFTVNLTVTDAVGWKSVNATLTAIVNDTTAPVPAFDILDPSRDWTVATTLTERKAYSFNASRTTDNNDEDPELNFTWTIPGPVSVGGSRLTGSNHTFYGLNITFTWEEWNASYRVMLSVRDTGFGSGVPNYGNQSRNITVQVDQSIRPDLHIVTGSMTVTPTTVEEGAQITVTVNVTNKASRGPASNVVTELSLLGGTPDRFLLANSAEWRTSEDQPRAPGTIASGETVRLIFRATVTGGQGNRTIEVYVYDTEEPTTWRTGENRATVPGNVAQPWWQPYAIWGSVIGVIVLFVFGMYARRKIKAGEWRPVRGRRAKGEGEERKPRREVKEEKKRL